MTPPPPDHSVPPREPLLNVPAIISGLAAMMVVVHAWRTWLIDDETGIEVLLAFAFIPARYEQSLAASWGFPGGVFGDAWAFVTYAFLHGDWVHLGVNVVWMAVFGSAVARRCGAWRTLALFILGAVAGAVAHLVAHGAALAPMVGASASVSAFTAAALRFAFEPDGPLRGGLSRDPNAYLVPRSSLSAMATNATVMLMIAVWVVANVLFGAINLPLPGAEGSIAWQAHLGGFLAGLLMFPMVDPIPSKAQRAAKEKWPTE